MKTKKGLFTVIVADGEKTIEIEFQYARKLEQFEDDEIAEFLLWFAKFDDIWMDVYYGNTGAVIIEQESGLILPINCNAKRIWM